MKITSSEYWQSFQNVDPDFTNISYYSQLNWTSTVHGISTPPQCWFNFQGTERLSPHYGSLEKLGGGGVLIFSSFSPLPVTTWTQFIPYQSPVNWGQVQPVERASFAALLPWGAHGRPKKQFECSEILTWSVYFGISFSHLVCIRDDPLPYTIGGVGWCLGWFKPGKVWIR